MVAIQKAVIICATIFLLISITACSDKEKELFIVKVKKDTDMLIAMKLCRPYNAFLPSALQLKQLIRNGKLKEMDKGSFWTTSSISGNTVSGYPHVYNAMSNRIDLPIGNAILVCITHKSNEQ